ncbi:MAG: FitA-like ribbon-helix-helix domain-containing protein [Bryobacteraceae bacterium]
MKVRNLPDWLVEWHRQREASEGISLEQRIRMVIEDAYKAGKRRLRRRLDQLAEETRRKCGELPGSVPLIRAIRREMEGH